MMIWIPFRLNTVYIKHIYCEGADDCATDFSFYCKDSFIFIVLFMAFVFLMASLTRKNRRRSQGILGGSAVMAVVAIVILVLVFPNFLSDLSEHWQFYAGIAIVVIIVLFALWQQFDPANVRLRDFNEIRTQLKEKGRAGQD
jgi:Na+/melibiose symporter-like transporter